MNKKNSKEIKKEEEAVLFPALNKIYKINKIRREKIGMKKRKPLISLWGAKKSCCIKNVFPAIVDITPGCMKEIVAYNRDIFF